MNSEELEILSQVQFGFLSIQNEGLAYLIAEPDVVIKLDGPGGELTNRPDMVSPRSPDGAGMHLMPQMSKNLRGCV